MKELADKWKAGDIVVTQPSMKRYNPLQGAGDFSNSKANTMRVLVAGLDPVSLFPHGNKYRCVSLEGQLSAATDILERLGVCSDRVCNWIKAVKEDNSTYETVRFIPKEINVTKSLLRPVTTLAPNGDSLEGWIIVEATEKMNLKGKEEVSDCEPIASAVTVYAAPGVTTYAAPAQTMSAASAETTYAAPTAMTYAAPGGTTYAVPAATTRAASAETTYAAPAAMTYTSPGVTMYAAPGETANAAPAAMTYTSPGRTTYTAPTETTCAAPAAMTSAAPTTMTYMVPTYSSTPVTMPGMTSMAHMTAYLGIIMSTCQHWAWSLQCQRQQNWL